MLVLPVLVLVLPVLVVLFRSGLVGVDREGRRREGRLPRRSPPEGSIAPAALVTFSKSSNHSLRTVAMWYCVVSSKPVLRLSPPNPLERMLPPNPVALLVPNPVDLLDDFTLLLLLSVLLLLPLIPLEELLPELNAATRRFSGEELDFTSAVG